MGNIKSYCPICGLKKIEVDGEFFDQVMDDTNKYGICLVCNPCFDEHRYPTDIWAVFVKWVLRTQRALNVGM